MSTYCDLDLSFKKHPGSKDVLKSYDVEAVKTAIRNIFMYNMFEKPFDPLFGMNLRKFLFEDFSVLTTPLVQRHLQDQIDQYEPRAVIDSLTLDQASDDHSIHIEVKFHAIGFANSQTVNLVVERTR